VKRRAQLSGAYLAEFDRTLTWAKLPTSKGNVWARSGLKIADTTIPRWATDSTRPSSSACGENSSRRSALRSPAN
jgi:hypothetical protein